VVAISSFVDRPDECFRTLAKGVDVLSTRLARSNLCSYDERHTAVSGRWRRSESWQRRTTLGTLT